MTNSQILRRMHSGRPATRAGRRGFVMIAFALALLLILGSIGLTVDLGRMYITKGEAQSFVDSAALAAAKELNGQNSGITNAKAAALATVKGWEFGTKPFDTKTSTISVTFGKSLADSFVETPTDPFGYVCARVVVSDVRLPMFFMPVLTNVFSSNIAARATAKQMLAPGPGEGAFAPFSPFAHPNMVPEGSPRAPDYPDPFNMLSAEIRGAEPPNNLRHGGLYTLLWPNNNQVQMKLTDSDTVCPGDQYPEIAALKVTSSKTINDPTGNSSRGYLYNSGNELKDIIKFDILPTGYDPIQVGQEVYTDYYSVSKGAVHVAVRSALANRSSQDSDHDSLWYQDYVRGGHGDGRRVIVVPINAGPSCGDPDVMTFDSKTSGVLSYVGTNSCTFPDPTDLTKTKTYESYEVIQFARFFLLPPEEYSSKGGAENACAEYVGPGALVGGNGPGGAGPGVYRIKLVE